MRGREPLSASVATESTGAQRILRYLNKRVGSKLIQSPPVAGMV
jgi:hypothetical protein